jgi:hypothetical protein
MEINPVKIQTVLRQVSQQRKPQGNYHRRCFYLFLSSFLYTSTLICLLKDKWRNIIRSERTTTKDHNHNPDHHQHPPSHHDRHSTTTPSTPPPLLSPRPTPPTVPPTPKSTPLTTNHNDNHNNNDTNDKTNNTSNTNNNNNHAIEKVKAYFKNFPRAGKARASDVQPLLTFTNIMLAFSEI